jgi:hypothetical protein
MIGSHSCSIAMAFKGVSTFGTLGANNHFLNSFQVDGTIATNCPMMILLFVISHLSSSNKYYNI